MNPPSPAEIATLRERLKAIGLHFAERAQEHESARDCRNADTLRAALALLDAQAAEIARLTAEREREGAWRRQAIRHARAIAIEDAARVAEWSHMVPPDGGSPTEAEHDVAKEAARRIRALLAPAPAAEVAGEEHTAESRYAIYGARTDGDGSAPVLRVWLDVCRTCPTPVIAWSRGEYGAGYLPIGPCQNRRRCGDRTPLEPDDA